MYVLAIPSFTWINITTTGSQEEKLSASVGRYTHTCSLYGVGSLIVVGGTVILDTGFEILNDRACNASYPSIRLLDTTSFEWQGQFSPESGSYSVPDQVSKVIGGGSVLSTTNYDSTMLRPP